MTEFIKESGGGGHRVCRYVFAVREQRTSVLYSVYYLWKKTEMLKPQDCVILVKLLANPGTDWTQRYLAKVLGISVSEINAGIKRLGEAGLLRKDKREKLYPNIDAVEEFLISGIKFFFPAKLGEYTRGVPTISRLQYFTIRLPLGNDPIPVWPDVIGEKRGVALLPLSSIPKVLRENPDQLFYEMLVLIDAIRSGRARERNVAASLLKEKLKNAKQ